MKNFMFSEVGTSPYGGYYQQTIWCVDGDVRVRVSKMWRDGEVSYTLSRDYYTDTAGVTNDTLLTAFVAAWQDACQHDDELEADARLQTERHGYEITLNAFRRTWGTDWISGDRPAWAGGG